MNKILSCMSGIVFSIFLISFYLYSELHVSGDWLLFGSTVLVGSIYSIWVDSFWKKITKDEHSDKHLKELLKMLIRYRRDEATLRVIMWKISSEEMQDTLRRNCYWIVRDIVQGESKGRHHLYTTVRVVCELLRESALKRFEQEVKSLTKGSVLHATNENFIKLFNEKTVLCFLEAGGYPTWGDVQKILLPLFKGINRNDAEMFLLTVEDRFRPEKTRAYEYLQVEGAYRNLIQGLRREILKKEKAPA